MSREPPALQDHFAHTKTCMEAMSTARILMPASSLTFTPDAWNDATTAEDTNCFSYAADCAALGFSYLGLHFTPRDADIDKSSQMHLEFWERQRRFSMSSGSETGGVPEAYIEYCHARLAEIHGLEPILEHGADPSKDHVIAFSAAAGHFWRLDEGRTWSHKNNTGLATDRDMNGDILLDLAAARHKEHTADPLPDLRYYRLPESGILVTGCGKVMDSYPSERLAPLEAARIAAATELFRSLHPAF